MKVSLSRHPQTYRLRCDTFSSLRPNGLPIQLLSLVVVSYYIVHPAFRENKLLNVVHSFHFQNLHNMDGRSPNNLITSHSFQYEYSVERHFLQVRDTMTGHSV